MAEGYEPRPRGDTGWVSLLPYINSDNVTPRNTTGYLPYVRIIEGILYFKGQVYISTAPTGNPDFITLFSNIPSKYMPDGEISNGSITYVQKRPYRLYIELKSRIRCVCTSYEVQSTFTGFDLSILSGCISSELD